jgi:hypothetical protein
MLLMALVGILLPMVSVAFGAADGCTAYMGTAGTPELQQLSNSTPIHLSQFLTW